MKTKSLTSNSMGFATSATLMLALCSPAQAVDFKVSGQINRAIVYADDGDESDFFHVDNDNSSTRIRFVGSGEIGYGLTVGIVWESQFESNSSANIEMGQDSDGDSSFSERKLEVYFSGGFGELWIGQGDGAANGTSEVDLSGTSVVTYSGIGDMMGGLYFKDSAGANVARIKDAFNNFDGLSRNDRLRYDTPSLGPVTLSISATNGDAYELAGRLAQDFGDAGRIAAAIGYVDTTNRGDSEFDQWGGSISYLHGSGLNLTAAAGSRDTDGGTDADNWYFKVGYKSGKHAVSLDYGETEDLALDGDDFSSIGLGYVFNIFDGVELYTAYRNHELDRSGVSIDDIDGVMAGTRVKFF